VEYRLIRDLLRNYDHRIRPSLNASEPLNVTFGLALAQIIDVVRTLRLSCYNLDQPLEQDLVILVTIVWYPITSLQLQKLRRATNAAKIQFCSSLKLTVAALVNVALGDRGNKWHRSIFGRGGAEWWVRRGERWRGKGTKHVVRKREEPEPGRQGGGVWGMCCLLRKICEILHANLYIFVLFSVIWGGRKNALAPYFIGQPG